MPIVIRKYGSAIYIILIWGWPWKLQYSWDYNAVPHNMTLQYFSDWGSNKSVFKATFGTPFLAPIVELTHWGRVTQICVNKLATIGSYNGLSPGRRQAIIWTNGRILLIVPLGKNFSEVLTEFNIFSFKKMHLKLSSGNRRPLCLGLNMFKSPLYG